jgi:hypothetical protein
VIRSVQLVVSYLSLVSTLAAVAGVFVRGRQRDCWSFATYLVVVSACEGAIAFWPERFFQWWFFVTKESLYNVLKIAVALELAHRAFHVFPGARATARRVVFTVLAASTVLIGASSALSSDWTDWQPPVVSATIWLFGATATLVVWYRLPLHMWHRAILAGFAPYLLVFVTLLSVLEKQGALTAYAALGLLDSIAYLAVMVCWAFVAWRRPLREAAWRPLERAA